MNVEFRVWSKIEKKFIDDDSFMVDMKGVLFLKQRIEIKTDFRYGKSSYVDAVTRIGKSPLFTATLKTNRVDAEGTPLYEGDIVKIHNFDIGEVKYFDNLRGWGYSIPKRKKIEYMLPPYNGDIIKLGNKFEHEFYLKL